MAFRSIVIVFRPAIQAGSRPPKFARTMTVIVWSAACAASAIATARVVSSAIVRPCALMVILAMVVSAILFGRQ